MSRYGYDYPLTPRQNGWRSVFRNVLMVGAIAAISAVSGGVVALDLLGPGSAVTDRPALVSPPVQPASVRVARTVTPPAASAPTNAGAAIEKPQAAAATATAAPAQPSPTPAPEVAQAPMAPTASVEQPKGAQGSAQASAQVPESELTFTTGYARRRAMQTAATAGSGTKTEVAHIEEQNQVGRGAKAKPKSTVARQNGPQDQRRVADAHDEQPAKFDFARHQQALALGDPRDPRANRRPPPPQQQGGLFGSSFGGMFRGLF
jgi:hypothetical protein